MSPEPATHPGGRRPWAGPLGLAVLLAGAFFVGLGTEVPLGSHEALLAETARNMVLRRPVTLADGSQPSPWLIPNFDGALRLRKTPLPYWLAAACAKAGGGVTEWTARLPSAVAAVGTVLLVAALAWRRHGRPSALAAAAMLATMAEFLLMARRAAADMELVFFTTACLAALWMAVERRGRSRLAWLTLAGTAAGLAMMAKGPNPLIILPLPALVAAVLMFAGGGPREDSSGSRPEAPGQDRSWTVAGLLSGAAVFLAVTVPWYLYVYLRLPDALTVWRKEAVDRTMGEFGHGEPPWFYLVRLPLLVLPWTFFVGYGIWLAMRGLRTGGTAAAMLPRPCAPQEHGHANGRVAVPPGAEDPQSAIRNDSRAWLLYLGAWAVGPLLAFSLASGKQDHYTLPILPAMALYAAMALERFLGAADARAGATDDRARTVSRVIIAHGLALAVAGVGAFAYFGWTMPEHAAAAAVLSGLLVAGALVTAALALRGRPGAGLAALLAACVAALVWSGPTLVAPMDRSAADARFAMKVKALAPPDADICSLRDVNATVVFYSERRMQIVNSAADIRDRMALGRPFYLVTIGKDAKEAQIPEGLRLVYHEDNPREPERSRDLFFWPGKPR